MIFLRSVAFNVYFFTSTFILSLMATAARPATPDEVMFHAMRWARVTIGGLRVICGIRLEVTGREHLPEGPALIASAHRSAFDTLVWMLLVPRCCYVLKQELLRIPLLGKLIGGSGMIAIDRASGASALRTLLRGAERARQEVRQIVIFPEGTRVSGEGPQTLQAGVAAIAARTGLPVIPVATDSGDYWGRRAFRKYPGVIRIIIRPPLPATLPRDELMRRLGEDIRL